MDKGTENKFFQKNLKWVVAIICSCIFIYMCTILNKDEIIYLDHIVYNFISKFSVGIIKFLIGLSKANSLVLLRI